MVLMLMTAVEYHKYTINLNIAYVVYYDGGFGGGDGKGGIHGGVYDDYIDDNDDKVNGDCNDDGGGGDYYYYYYYYYYYRSIKCIYSCIRNLIAVLVLITRRNNRLV